MGARKQQSQAPRLTTEQGMPCTDGTSLQDRHSAAQACLLPSLGSIHRWARPRPGIQEPCLKPTRGLMGLGPSWVFAAHKEQRDRQSAEAEGSTRRQAASTSPCHSILSWFFLLGGEKEQTMRSVTAYPVGCILSPQLTHQFLLAGSKASILVPPLQMTKQRPREAQWGPQAKGQGR